MRCIKYIFIVSVAVLGTILLISSNASAEDTKSAQGLQISPAKVELNAAPGKTYDIRLSVTNVTADDLVYSSMVSDFSAANETGSPRITIDPSMPNTASIRSWVSGLDDFRLNSRESKTINAQVSIPINAEPGGHYGVLSFSGSAPDVSGTGVGLSASAGVIILIRVDGDITEKATLSSFYSGSLDKPSFFFESSPIPFIVRVKNEGNVHIKPVGTIEVTDMFGNLVKSIVVNDAKANVLPDSIRRFGGSESEKIQAETKSLMFGRYTARLALGYGTKGDALTSTISFWVVPYKLLLAALIVLGTVLYIIKRMLMNHNRRVIERYKSENGYKKSNKR